MSRLDGEGVIRLLSRTLASTVRLPGAACAGRPELFDPAGEYEPRQSVIRRHEAAARMCTFTCPALDECRAWFTTLPPSRRPSGVVAGHRPPISAAPGRPRKASA